MCGRRGCTLHSSSLGKSSAAGPSGVGTVGSGVVVTSSWASLFSSSSCNSSTESVHTSKRSGHSLLKCPGFPHRKHDVGGSGFLRARSMSIGTGFPGLGTRCAFGRVGTERTGRTLEQTVGVAGVLCADWKALFIRKISKKLRRLSQLNLQISLLSHSSGLFLA